MKCLFVIWKWDQDLFEPNELFHTEYNTQNNNKLIAIKEPESDEFDGLNYEELFINLKKLCLDNKEGEIIWLIHKNVNSTYYSKINTYLSKKHTVYPFESGTSCIYYNEYLSRGLLSTYDRLDNKVFVSPTSDKIKNSIFDKTWNFYYYNNKEVFELVEKLSIIATPHLLGFESDTISDHLNSKKLIVYYNEFLEKSSQLKGNNANAIQELLKQNGDGLSSISFQKISLLYKEIYRFILDDLSPIY